MPVIDDDNFNQFRRNLSLVLSGFQLTPEQAETLKTVITMRTDISLDCPCSECREETDRSGAILLPASTS